MGMLLLILTLMVGLCIKYMCTCVTGVCITLDSREGQKSRPLHVPKSQESTLECGSKCNTALNLVFFFFFQERAQLSRKK